MVAVKGQNEGAPGANCIAAHIEEIHLAEAGMFGWEKKRATRERLDLLSRELFQAMRATEEEIDETARQPELLSRIERRIAAKQRQSRERGFSNHFGWAAVPTAIAAAILVLTFAVRWTRTNQATPPANPPADRPSDLVVTRPVVTPQPRTLAPLVVPEQPSASKTHKVHRYRRSDATYTQLAELMSEEQQATEFLPLTFIPDDRAGEGRQIVRVTLPRTTLLAFGVPMNMERTGELVTADVMLGDDGVARAIRFVH